ncbi:MAG TPA: NAD-dependent epimerase/dehydratase family protein [Solirubrobacteraceae bacterium]
MPDHDLPLAGASTVLVTGAAGFVGSHMCERLVEMGHDVVGVDCFTDFYARSLKEANLVRLRDEPSFRFLELDLSRDDLGTLLDGVEVVFHLAAQAGVRGSFGETFATYLRHNLRATQRLLEAARQHTVSAFVYASSSSVYGNATVYPTTEHTPRRPVSPYGMTKAATEDLTATYRRCFGIPVVGLRYFTVYGPRQRPDMAFSRFLRRILDGEPLTLLGDGTQVRDFTYVDDVVEGTIAAARHGRPGCAYNIGGGHAVQLIAAIRMIERLAERRARIELAPPQLGDAYRTGCDGQLALSHLGYVARTTLQDGLAAQLEWTLDLQPFQSAA